MSRNLIIGIVVAAVVIAGVAIGLSVGLGGDDDDGDSAETTAQTTTAPATDLFAGIPQTGATLGAEDAPIEIVEFADLQCPFCAQASEEVTPDLVSEFVEPGEARIQFVSIAFIGPDSERGAIAVEAAAEQDMGWQMAEALFAKQGGENSGWLSDDVVFATAEEIGLDMDAFRADFASDEVAQAIFDNQSTASDADVSSTPTYVVTGPNGTEVVPGADLSAVRDAVDQVS